ncbi:WYL domain-containing protein [Pedobacter sp. JY14-1]|uniref:helix-turn-helix transcriptional regulator n=1 Tax=Pedobacter sp. JY14-1 TaxID=3034151 RepID=UPI0023E19CC8|nr:WYL domain-containing protein [Pedobacter sp. JY14-1]
MSQTKNQLARFRVINDCLTSPKKFWSKTDLLRKISNIDIDVSNRTLDGDIALMRHCQQLNYKAPIKYCRINKGYHYTDPDYSIDHLPLNQSDIKALELAATTLAQYQYIPIMKEFNTTIEKIIRVVNRAKRSNYESILDFIIFEKTPVALGLEHTDTLIEAIQSKRSLSIIYQKFGYEPSPSQIFHPYFLKEYRNRWYVIGFNETKNEVRTYGLDRIKTLQFAPNKYILDTTFDNKEYLGHCVGINLGSGKIETVRLLFSPSEGYYPKTQPLHKSQIIVESCPEKGLTLEYQLIINYEFIGIILSYGADVKVLEPNWLADKIVRISNSTALQYQEDIP